MTVLPHFIESAAFLLRSRDQHIGALKFRKIEKEVTNEAYWRPKFQKSLKRGHQWGLLPP